MRSGVSVSDESTTFLAGCEIHTQLCAYFHISIYSDFLQNALWIFTSKSAEDFIQCSHWATKSTYEITVGVTAIGKKTYYKILFHLMIMNP